MQGLMVKRPTQKIDTLKGLDCHTENIEIKFSLWHLLNHVESS